MLVPKLVQAIHEVEFDEAGKRDVGYDKSAVDDFVNQLLANLETVGAREQELEEALAKAEEENSHLAESLSAAEDAPQVAASADVTSSVTLLSTAEKVAREHVQEAQSNAESIVNDAAVQAEEIVASRRAEYDELEVRISSLNDTYEQLRSAVRTNLTPFLDAAPSVTPTTPATASEEEDEEEPLADETESADE